VTRTVTFKEMNGLFASLIRHEYFADVRMFVIQGNLRMFCPQQHPQITRYNIRRSAFYHRPIPVQIRSSSPCLMCIRNQSSSCYCFHVYSVIYRTESSLLLTHWKIHTLFLYTKCLGLSDLQTHHFIYTRKS